MGWFEERFERKDGRHMFSCINCNREMFFPACKVGKYKTCSSSCSISVRRTKMEDRARHCETCGKHFSPRKTQIAAGNGRFCSQACNAAARTALTSAASQEKAASIRRARFASGELVGLRGDKNPRWRGGRDVERARARVRAYKRENPDMVRAWAANRRSKGGERLRGSYVKELLFLQKGRCAACENKVGRLFHLDHINPVALGGTGEKTNFQILCAPCNLKKGAKDPADFMRMMGKLL